MVSRTIRFLALGDSYTIGERVGVAERWPVQLAVALREHGFVVSDPIILALTGWTTQELLAGIRRDGPRGPFDLVTLQIGVNNQYRGGALEAYRVEFAALLEQAIVFAGDDARKVIVLSIPDWSVTPFAQGSDRRQIAAQIDRFNSINRQETAHAGAHYIDVTLQSRRAAEDPSLLAPDGLHPSGKMYAAWAQLALPLAVDVLKESSP